MQKIRQFLTGTALTVVLDAIFAVIYIAVMLLYSVQLTIWSLVVVPLFVGLTFVSALREQAEANARVQSHLVETVGGMETIKGLEIYSRRWQQLYGSQIHPDLVSYKYSCRLCKSRTTFWSYCLWIGASLVLKGELTLGQLIAFRILASYVTSPYLMANPAKFSRNSSIVGDLQTLLIIHKSWKLLNSHPYQSWVVLNIRA